MTDTTPRYIARATDGTWHVLSVTSRGRAMCGLWITGIEVPTLDDLEPWATLCPDCREAAAALDALEAAASRPAPTVAQRAIDHLIDETARMDADAQEAVLREAAEYLGWHLDNLHSASEDDAGTITGPPAHPLNEREKVLVARAERQGIGIDTLCRDPWGELWVAGSLPLIFALHDEKGGA